MGDYINNILSKLANSIESVNDEKEMLLRIIIGAAFFILLTVFRKQLSSWVVWIISKTFARKSKPAQRAIKDALTKPLSFFIFVLAVYGAMEIIVPGGKIRSPFLVFLKLGIIFCVAWFAVNFINSDFSLVLKGEDSKTKKTAVNFISNIFKILIIVVAALLALEQFGISATRVFAALGIGGVAVAFACKDAVENLLSGFIIIYDKPFEVDDFIKIDGETGQVEEIKIRTTRLRMLDGSEKIIPNTTVANASVINTSRMNRRQIDETIGVSYKHTGEELRSFCKGLKELIMSYDETDKSDVRVHFTDYGDSALLINVCFYANISALTDFLEFKSAFNSDLKDFADKENIDLAFPSNSLYFENELKIKK